MIIPFFFFLVNYYMDKMAPYNLENFTVNNTQLCEQYGFDKEEFNELPAALRKAILTEPEEIGKSFSIPAKEELRKREILEQEKMQNIIELKPMRALKGEVINKVGTYVQKEYYTCGPSAAKNAIAGYEIHNGGDESDAPSISTLSDDLNTTTDGTGFESHWEESFWGKVKFTLNRTNNYNVIVNLYGDITSSSQINSEYNVGDFCAHYVCAFGYDPIDKMVFVQYSHDKHSIHNFRVPHKNIARACKGRGIIW